MALVLVATFEDGAEIVNYHSSFPKTELKGNAYTYNITLSCVQKKVILIGFGSGSTFFIFSASLWLWLHLLLQPVKMELKLSITAPALQTNLISMAIFIPESPAID